VIFIIKNSLLYDILQLKLTIQCPNVFTMKNIIIFLHILPNYNIINQMCLNLYLTYFLLFFWERMSWLFAKEI